MQDIRNSISQELTLVEQTISHSTQSNLSLVNTIGDYALNQPGRKLMRPQMILLFAKSINYESDDAIKLAAIIELIHSATLLHDDVIDHADIRRNKATTHKLFGGTQSILMGDFIYSAAFKLIASLKNPEITYILAQATSEIVEGEILQMSLQNNVDTSLSQYFSIIRSKTALLFSTGAKCIATLAQHSTTSLESYGKHFGMLYQITDDILDIDTSNTQLNKAHGTDLSEGKMTLPTILAYQNAQEADQAIITQVVQGKLPWQDILPVIERTNAINRCKDYTQAHCDDAIQALSQLPNSIYKSHLLNLVSRIPSRKL